MYCPNGSVYQVTRHVLESMTDTDNPQSVCAAVKTPDIKLPDEYPEGLIVALDCVQDPGNMGTIIRTADAMGAAGLLLSSGCADPFGPKVLRSTMGSIYHLPIWQGELAAELVKLKSEDFRLICGHLAGNEILPEPGRRCVLIIGNEGNGVSDAVAELCDKYRLPMFGRAESLNASATSILAKVGIEGVGSNLATAIRTMVVVVMAWIMVLITNQQGGISGITPKSWLFLCLSGLATGASWLFYYRAIQIGEVSKVVPIDKLSVVITLILAFVFLHERFTWKSAVGAALITAGTLVMVL